jgi:hypothetical protein
VRRLVKRGLVQSIVNEFELLSVEGGTRVTVRISVEPKMPLLAPVVRMQVRRFVERICREIARVDAELSHGRSPKSKTFITHVEASALERAALALRQRSSRADAALVEALVKHVAGSSDADVSRIRPFELADAWGADLLEGVRAGLLELRWDLVCPSCRTASDSMPSLKDLPESGHCQLCDISFELELDRAVEATSAPARGLRSVDTGPYCIGGPAKTPQDRTLRSCCGRRSKP